ncbi:MAG: hypothetical protein IT210_03115 [Armatimonadetes bacterium]|nr:hypothetical protein [Armatimonadota bacterium]
MLYRAAISLLAACLVAGNVDVKAEGKKMAWPDTIQRLLENTRPLRFKRGGRLPLYLWPAMNPGKLEAADAEKLVRELDRRGVGLVCAWDWNRKEESLAAALSVARAQKKLGQRINIDATSSLYSFFNGDERTAHIDREGKPFWDGSFGKKDMGCPFALDFRQEDIRRRIEYFADAYAKEKLEVGFVFADWEIDGPLEWNDAWEASRRCQRCREHIPGIDTNFLQFQKDLRDIRSRLQKDNYADPILLRFPKALVGNYAVYPHNGFRYWYDYFEKYGEGQPALADQGARYRHWANEFEQTGYTFAMPVVYTWYGTYLWYDFDAPDYRWFYNMLLVASNPGQYTPPSIPVITFVHWHTTSPPDKPDPSVKQMSEWAYQELLWHMLLRGTDTFFLWCGAEEQVKEVSLLHPVWAAAQEYGEFLEKGTPVTFDVPARPGTVLSALRLGSRLLVRRTDFTSDTRPVTLKVEGRSVAVPAAPSQCQVLTLDEQGS